MSKKPIIVFEGIEGSGKSHHISTVSKYLTKNKIDHIKIREPGGNINSEKIRKLILNNKSNFNKNTDLLLYLAARSENINIIKKNYKKKIILIDRFIELTGDLKVSDIVVQSKIGVKQKGDTGKFRDFDWITDGATVAAAGTVFEFSDTISPVKEVYLDYQVWDIGYQFDLSKFFKGVNLSITPLIGHVRYQEKAKAFGLFDLPDDLGAGSGWTFDTDTLVLQNQILWTGTRLGTEINWQASPKSNFLTNIAYVEGMDVRNEDSHVLRGDLGPTPNVISKGDGRGWMIDLIGEYAYNNNLGFELGYRYWRFEDRNASVLFGPDLTGSLPVRQLYSQRQGFMLGAEYTF